MELNYETLGLPANSAHPKPALADVVSRGQVEAMRSIFHGEEREWLQAVMDRLNATLCDMPRVYEQDGLGVDAVAHLHYFRGGADWYITELDSEREQHQAFGAADLGHGPELGYISLVELAANDVELDLHFEPQRLRECCPALAEALA